MFFIRETFMQLYYIFSTYVARAFCTLNLWLSRSTATVIVNLLHADKLSELCISDSAIQPLVYLLFAISQRAKYREICHRTSICHNVASLIMSRDRANQPPVLAYSHRLTKCRRFPPSVCIEYVFQAVPFSAKYATRMGYAFLL